MAMIAGKAGSVKADATVPTPVYSVTSWEFDYQGDAIETTGMSDGGKRTYIGGLTGGNFTFECFEDTDHVLNADITPGATILVEFRYVSTDSSAWHGSGIVTSLKPTVAVDGAVKWTVTGTMTGTIEYAVP
jgi:hypothetical protein